MSDYRIEIKNAYITHTSITTESGKTMPLDNGLSIHNCTINGLVMLKLGFIDVAKISHQTINNKCNRALTMFLVKMEEK